MHTLTQAIVARISSTDDNDIQAFRINVAVAVLQLKIVFDELAGVLGQEIHSLVDPFALSSRKLEVTPDRGSDGEYDSIIVFLELVDVDVDSDVCVGNEDDALVFQQLDMSIDVFLL